MSRLPSFAVLLILGSACGSGASHSSANDSMGPDTQSPGADGGTEGTASDPPAGASGSSDGGSSPSGSGLTARCTSGDYWSPQRHHGPEMRPGEPCIACHQQMSTRLSIGGTVYPTLHEVDDCLGVAGGLQVVLTASTGRQLTLAVNGAGNFYSPGGPLAGSYRVKVVSGTLVREMSAPVTSGNCNECHTPAGAMGAAGRILPP